MLKPGSLVYIDDGLISLRVETVGEDYLDCEIINSAWTAPALLFFPHSLFHLL